jgi:plastocyanin domain-containing protein
MKFNLLNINAVIFGLSMSLIAASPLQAADLEIPLIIKNHSFEPSTLKVPANQRIKLTIHNQDNSPEEFESHALNREKIVPAASKVVIYIGPLKPGRYEFVGEFNAATAQGVVVAE